MGKFIRFAASYLRMKEGENRSNINEILQEVVVFMNETVEFLWFQMYKFIRILKKLILPMATSEQIKIWAPFEKKRSIRL